MKKNNSKTGTSTEIIALAINGLERWENQDLTIDDFLDSEPVETSNLRRSVSSILFNYFRNKPLIDALIRKFAVKVRGRDRRIIAVATVQILFQDAISRESAVNIAVDLAKKRFGKRTSGFINAVLRNISKIDIEQFRAALSPWDLAGIPQSLYNHWQRHFPENIFHKMLTEINQESSIFFRQCKDISQAHLETTDSHPVNLPWLNGFNFFLCRNPGTLLSGPWLSEGKIYIQDPATAMAVSMIDFNRKIQRALDLCAAPGGKSLMIAEKLADGAELIAADRSAKRQQLTRLNFANHGFSQHQVMVASATDNIFEKKSFDLVFIDVPCSNTGVFRRRPDAMWKWSEKKTSALMQLQEEILTSGSRLLKPDGQLIYSTCTIDPMENQHLIDKFITANPEFKLIKQQTLMPGISNDGAFAAKIML